jgi:farnesyl diphosphate synthase
MPGMIGGQMLDVGFRAGEESEDAYAELTARKTGALIAAAAEAGAALGGARPADRARLAAFGAAIGRAFQLRDDLDDAGQEGGRAAFRPNEASFLGPARSRARLAELLRSARDGLASAGLLTEELRALTLVLEPPPSEGTHD